MALTPNAQITELDQAQSQKEISINAALLLLDANTGELDVTLVNGTNNLTSTQVSFGIIDLKGALTGTATAVVPAAFGKAILFRNDTTGGFTVNVQYGAGSPVVAPLATPVLLWPTGHHTFTVGSSTLAGDTDVSFSGTAQGDVIYYDGAHWVNLPHGTAGQVLTTHGAAANPTWTTVTGGTGNVTSTGAEGAEPGSPSSGDLYFPNNGPGLERWSGSAWVVWGPIFPLTKPLFADFTFVNQGGATLVNNTDSLCLKAPQNGGAHNCRILEKTAPATPYTITAYIDAVFMAASSDDRFGLLFRESGTGKLSVFQYAGTSTGAELRVTFYSSPTTPVSNGVSFAVPQIFRWMQISDDGVNRIYRVSPDGQNWVQYFSETRTNNLTADQVGWFADPTAAGGVNIDSYVTLYSWLQS
jgi:hypothetical protein